MFSGSPCVTEVPIEVVSNSLSLNVHSFTRLPFAYGQRVSNVQTKKEQT